MTSQKGIARCPRCDRTIATTDARYGGHSGTNGERCAMSGMHTPYRARQQTPTDYVGRAHIVASLAARLQDEDPAITWEYLTAMPADELQRLMVLALAAIPVDKPLPEIWAWVCELPLAQLATVTA